MSSQCPLSTILDLLLDMQFVLSNNLINYALSTQISHCLLFLCLQYKASSKKVVWSGLRGTECGLRLNITGDPCVGWKVLAKVRLKLIKEMSPSTLHSKLEKWCLGTMPRNARDTWHVCLSPATRRVSASAALSQFVAACDEAMVQSAV